MDCSGQHMALKDQFYNNKETLPMIPCKAFDEEFDALYAERKGSSSFRVKLVRIDQEQTQ